ncbi:hypothetical protein DPMN_000929 [Dreissena polymorpha]|uniref:Uncharacterized protein n=1 Tax=Dreissena polymorpha TaxID=45954 RepID=A0A9D4MID3_DREPO|nr:hypothetical protein DPMN_000929 [Dreissena polymorpha]
MLTTHDGQKAITIAHHEHVVLRSRRRLKRGGSERGKRPNSPRTAYFGDISYKKGDGRVHKGDGRVRKVRRSCSKGEISHLKGVKMRAVPGRLPSCIRLN